MNTQRMTLPVLMERKKTGRKITAVTAYDYSMARLLDGVDIDLVLVGDSVGMVSLGYDTTLPVTMDEMIHHTRAVRRGVGRALVVGDMPFMSYHVSDEETIRNAGRFIQEGGAEAVKLEGGVKFADRVRAVVDAGISVMGHIGLTPQSIHQFGGYRVQGKNYYDSRQIKKDALALQKAGVFAIVLEAIPAELAAEITSEIDIPTIGIGAGRDCDGQILVLNDLLGLNQDFTPKFVKRFAELGEAVQSALRSYVDEVQTGTFPTAEHTYNLKRKPLREAGNQGSS
ncbi:3-methyl-2-oxobutanoate hydroxymethyltransferase [Nitrospina gracilis]|uniref:3-methyl-2-oxobutanoate hydroxymethyltransferase n=1 Tax=Nitrospina gracilis TaxID=35801 RepID=UPI001F030ADD|nr:3-methyl-2-oxobutanoate hydroxymethyltransferase [Nitrospina gracilis]MCF8721022.1 3-methyl-2-oxobutanoate hydroxymethyltransferase [Nitrospina gracilis Nb-211]